MININRVTLSELLNDVKDNCICNGDILLHEALKSHTDGDINSILLELLAKTAIWVDPRVVGILMTEEKHGSTNENALWYFNVRRRRTGDPPKGKYSLGIKMDDNTDANLAYKKACGANSEIKFVNFEVCHIKSEICYDPEYHTSITHIVLVPKAIASLTDHLDKVKDSLSAISKFLYYNESPNCEIKGKWNVIELNEKELKMITKSISTRKKIKNQKNIE